MRLRVPTDFDVLEILNRGKRQTPANVAAHVDKGRQYVRKRIKHLVEHGLATQVGPAPRSDMFVITARGQAALALREDYNHHRHERFEAELEAYPAEVVDPSELPLDAPAPVSRSE